MVGRLYHGARWYLVDFKVLASPLSPSPSELERGDLSRYLFFSEFICYSIHRALSAGVQV
jgi:hypothetical protein